MTKNIERAIARGLTYLTSQQQPEGGFASSSCSQQSPFTAEHTYQTTFTSAIMLAALSCCPEKAAVGIRTGLAAFLLRQKSEQWSFNYWARGSQASQEMPYPDDLDDTFCALSALWLHDASFVDETALARMVKLLIATESQVGGPYRTWLMPPGGPARWQDVDLAVNANVAYFLSLVSKPLPNLEALMRQAVQQQAFQSRYYPDSYPVVYFLSRAYQGDLRLQLGTYLSDHQQKDGSWKTPLHTALATTSLLRLGIVNTNVTRAIRWLLRQQEAAGLWGAEAFCIDPKRNGRTFYNGCAALTTALALESLAAYRLVRQKIARKRPVRQSADLLIKSVVAQSIQELQPYGLDLRRVTKERITHTAYGKNGAEIVLLPRQFAGSLRTNAALPERLLTQFGLANLYGWVAYTIYDDFLDDEGEPRLLSAANLAMRRSLNAFARAAPNQPAFQELVQATFDSIDTANAWEIVHCRFVVAGDAIMIGKLPAYGRLERLADRSLGHALTPLGVLSATGISPTHPAAQALYRALRQYLIARQLNDDAHDWRADLKAGRITYVLSTTLQDLQVRTGEQSLQLLLPRVEQQLWRHSIQQICRRMRHHIRRGRLELQQSDLLKPGNVIEGLFDKLDNSVGNTQATITQADQFLRAYRR